MLSFEEELIRFFFFRLGSVMGINANILPVLEQLGLYDQYAAISSPILKMHMLYGTMKKIATMGSNTFREL